MVLAVVTSVAESLPARRWWTCRSCGVKLAELVGDDTLVIAYRRDRQYVGRIPDDGMFAQCKCGWGNTITRDDARTILAVA